MISVGRALALLLAATLVAMSSASCGGPPVNKAGGASSPKPVVLTLANPFGDSQEVQGFAAEVQRLSGGRLLIDIDSRWRNGQTDFEDGLISDVRAGKAELGVVGARAWNSVGVTSFEALNAPLLIDSYALENKVLTSPMAGQMLAGLARLKLAGLGLLPGDLRYPVGARPLLGPSSYAGLRIGVQQSLVASATMRALGATPVWFPAQGPVTGLSGVEQSIDNLGLAAYRPVRRYLTGNVVLWPRPLVIFANARAFDRLTTSQQRMLREAVSADVIAESTFVRDDQAGAVAQFCRSQKLRFVTATTADLAALRRAVQPVYNQLNSDPATRREIARIQAMGKHTAPEPVLRCPPVLRTAAESHSSVLDGVWRFTLTLAQLIAAKAQNSELIQANYGTFTIVIANGRWAWTTVNRPVCVWAYGTLVIRGRTLTQNVTNGGGYAPDGGTNGPGEKFIYGWSLYRDVLTLRRITSVPPPTPQLATPWRRISTIPSLSALSHGCPPPANALGP